MQNHAEHMRTLYTDHKKADILRKNAETFIERKNCISTQNWEELVRNLQAIIDDSNNNHSH